VSGKGYYEVPSVLFNSAINCQGYIASLIGELMGMKYWWNDIDREKKGNTKRGTCSSATLPTTNPT
jgi:hypothetical protein